MCIYNPVFTTSANIFNISVITVHMYVVLPYVSNIWRWYSVRRPSVSCHTSIADYLVISSVHQSTSEQFTALDPNSRHVLLLQLLHMPDITLHCNNIFRRLCRIRRQILPKSFFYELLFVS